jgi:SAM-dependent methyltransferase
MCGLHERSDLASLVMAFEEFHDPAIAVLYDTVCPLSEDSGFHLALATELGARKLLDVGCGTGSLSVELARSGRHVTGVEPAEAMLAIARTRPSTELVTWVDGQASDVVDRGFDLALMTAHVAQVIADDAVLQKNFSAIAERLVPGGHLVFDSRSPVTQGQTWAKANRPARRFVHPALGSFEVRRIFTGNEGHVTHFELRYRFDNGRQLVSHNSLSFRSLDQLTEMLGVAGLRVETVWGDWDRSALADESGEMIFLAVR